METPKVPQPKPSTTTKRRYQGADAVMLTAALVILEAAAEPDILRQLQARRSRLTSVTIEDLHREVSDAIRNELGLNPAALRQQLTRDVYDAQAAAQKALSDFNLDLKDAFLDHPNPARLPELRARLGFRDHYAAASRNDQQALTELLATFVVATNDDNLRKELEQDLDIAPSLIDSIRAHRDFSDLDAAQELEKGKSRVITDEVIRKFNALYARVMVIARLSRSVHKQQPVIADRFSFSAVRRRMTGGTRPTE